MKGHGEKFSRKQELTILALLQQPTIRAAAQAAGVSDVTLWRWLQQPEFRTRYRAARRQVVEGALASLQQATSEAAATLQRNLTCGVPSVEIRAAAAILEQAVRAIELVDLEERLERLEAQLAPEEPPGRSARGWR
jgi:hypothetical protein